MSDRERPDREPTVHEVELLWFADCPNHPAARMLLGEVVAQVAPGSTIRDIDATDPDVARRVLFPGSPTIRVDGQDVQPGFIDPDDYTPRCRIYWTDEGLARVPPRSWIEAALRRQVAGDVDRLHSRSPSADA